jgi:cell wall-associated NlpC family hydrolase
MPSGKANIWVLLCAASFAFVGAARADETDNAAPPVEPSLVERYSGEVAADLGAVLDRALDLVGIRYRRGGSTPETGFDCSGFVRHVFAEGLGLVLPHNAREMSRSGEKVNRDELRPGDLVFFNTMRRAFSHVGIYLGDNRFIHAPASGSEVRVDDISSSYWVRHFNGARRIEVD